MKVVVKDFKNNEVVKSIIVSSQRKAEKVLAGLEINLNHQEYYAEIEAKESLDA